MINNLLGLNQDFGRELRRLLLGDIYLIILHYYTDLELCCYKLLFFQNNSCCRFIIMVFLQMQVWKSKVKKSSPTNNEVMRVHKKRC